MNQLETISLANNTDLLFSESFKQLINDFYRLTNTPISIPTISPIIERMRKSVILNLIINDPTSDEAIACVNNYVRNVPGLPRDFAARFVAVVSAKMTIRPQSIGFFNQSYSVKLSLRNCDAPKILTKFTSDVIREQLRQESQNTQIFSRSTPPSSNVAHALRLNMNQETLKSLINCMGDFYTVVSEGNRSNGFEVDPYINNQLK